MTEYQKAGIEYINTFLKRRLNKTYGDQITKFEVYENENCEIIAKTEMLYLPEHNPLRIDEKQEWKIQISKNGNIEAIIYPKYFQQFKGKKAFAINFK